MNAKERTGLADNDRENPTPLATLPASQPVVILGGFLAFAALYRAMGDTIHELVGAPVHIVPVTSVDWLPSMRLAGWSRILNKLHRTVQEAVCTSPTGKITLIGHSSGGVMGRLYLSPEPFEGYTYRGLDHVSILITLGSPHYNYQGGANRSWVETRYPGAYYPTVEYVSISSRAVMGDREGSPPARFAFRAYRRLCGVGEAWGDGLVPEASAMLEGSRQVTLSGIYHYGMAGKPWYGTPEAVANWWMASIQTSAPRPQLRHTSN